MFSTTVGNKNIPLLLTFKQLAKTGNAGPTPEAKLEEFGRKSKKMPGATRQLMKVYYLGMTNSTMAVQSGST